MKPFEKTYFREDIVEIATKEGIWCPAKVIGINYFSASQQISSIKIHYEGWSKNFDAYIVDESRIAKLGTNIEKYKGWVKISKFLYWPCIVYNRFPILQNQVGVDYLKQETKVFVKLCGNIEMNYKHWVNGKWISSQLVVSFHHNFDNIFKLCCDIKRVKKNSNNWIKAVSKLQKMEKDDLGYDIVNYNFCFDGTFEVDTGIF
jgi:hypothetical protein